VITPGLQPHEHPREPAKPDRWLVGLLAGAALMYLLGKAFDLGHVRQLPHDSKG
jgi:hypothetical protein